MYKTNDNAPLTAAGLTQASQRGQGERSEFNRTLSVIIRFHQRERLRFLEEAIFSLAIQDWHDIEPIVVLQNGTEELRQAVDEIITRQPWKQVPAYRVLTVPIAEGVDGRSTLLNEGIASASGRFLAFLDDDDFVYHHGYATLIGQLISGDKVIVIGGCRRANIRPEQSHWYVQSKDSFFSWGRSRFDLFIENFVPIHSYVIDRSRLGSFVLNFDDAFPPLEDYDFLLRLFAAFDPDLSKIEVPVCEYRIRMDGSNSIAYVAGTPPETVRKQKRAQQLIRALKVSLIQQMPVEQRQEFEKVLTPELFETHSADTSQETRPSENDPPSAPPPDDAGRLGTHEQPEESRVLAQMVREVYIFFSKHPQWELRLSRVLHWVWRARKRGSRIRTLPPRSFAGSKHPRLETKHESTF